MIKKTLTIVSMFLLTTTFIWAVWEGNAAAGSREEFPTGLFAYSDLFPKHTLIEVINLEQNTKSRAVIIGNKKTDGLLIKMSPDLAAALAIKTGMTVRVRVSLPALVSEKGADPVLMGKKSEIEKPVPAYTSSAPTQTAIQPAPRPEVYTAPKEVLPPKKANTSVMQAPPQPPRTVSEPVKPLAKKEAATVLPVSETNTPIKAAVVTPAPDPVSTAKPIAKEPADTKTEKPAPVAETTEPALPEKSVSASPKPVVEVAEPMTAPVSEAAIPEPVAETAVPLPAKEPTVSDDELIEAIPEVESPSTPVVAAEQDIPPNEVPVVEKREEPELYENYEAVPEYPPIVSPVPIEDAVADAEEPAAQSTEVPETIEENELVASNIPADIAETDMPTEQEVPTADLIAEVPPLEQNVMLIPVGPKSPVGEVPPPPKPEKKEQPVQPAVSSDSSDSKSVTAASESYTTDTLKRGSFYVQIGRFTDSLNVESFIHRYGKQYPITVEKSSGVKTTFYRVYVGPLKKDERGATLETFQKLGFKDAFLKKAP